MKKFMLFLMAFTVLFAFVVPDSADARRGGFKAPRQGYTQTPTKPNDNIRNTDQGTPGSAGSAARTGTAANRGGFFGGGSLMKGLMIGGLAGLLFGGLFGGMGFFGEFLGLLVNVLAIYLLFVLVRAAIRYFRNKPKTPEQRRPY